MNTKGAKDSHLDFRTETDDWLVVRDGRYNITARIANRAFLLRDPKLRTRIVDWIYGIAGFAGIEVDAWCIMENHIHLCVRVPPVPERYWAPRPSRGTGPLALSKGTDPVAIGGEF